MDNHTIKDVRAFKKMTQHEFAAWLGVSVATIAMIESGQRPVSDNFRGKLAHKFEVTEEFIEYRKRKEAFIFSLVK